MYLWYAEPSGGPTPGQRPLLPGTGLSMFLKVETFGKQGCSSSTCPSILPSFQPLSQTKVLSQDLLCIGYCARCWRDSFGAMRAPLGKKTGKTEWMGQHWSWSSTGRDHQGEKMEGDRPLEGQCVRVHRSTQELPCPGLTVGGGQGFRESGTDVTSREALV